MNNTSSLGPEDQACFKVDIFPLFVFSFLVNIFALLAVLKTRPKASTPNAARQIHLLICCLAASDTTSVGLQCLMPVASFINCGWWGGDITCALFGYINAILILWSAWIVAILSFQRFLVTVHPFKHRLKFTTKRIKMALISLFLVTCLLFSPPFFGIGEFVYYTTGQFCSLSLISTGFADTIFLSFVVSNGFFCIGLVVVFNIHVIFSLRSRRLVFHGQTVRAMNDSSATFVSLTKAVALVFCLCNIPLLIRIAVDLGKQTSKDELGMEHTITMALIFANSLANPFIYVACRRRYRNSLKLLCCGHCNGESSMDGSAAFVVVWTARNTQVLRGQRNEVRIDVQMTPIEVFNRRFELKTKVITQVN